MKQTTVNATKIQEEKKETEVKSLSLLKVTGKSIIKRVETVQILADKYEKLSNKYDSLTNFMAAKDLDECSMKFVSNNGYSFTLNNGNIIQSILEIVEKKFSEHLDQAEKQLINFKL